MRSAAWVACAVTLLLTPPLIAFAAEKRARLTINVTAQGTYRTQNKQGTDWAEGKFSEAYGFVTYFKASGDPEQYNTKDPAYGQKMMKRAGQARAAVAQAQGKSLPKKMSPEEFQAIMKKKQDACKGDKNCLYQAAMDASKMMPNVDMTGGQAAAASGDDDEDYDEDENPELNYLSYFGYENCGASAYVKVDRSSHGEYADVQGMVPWSETEHADFKAEPVQTKLICVSGSPVLDLKKKEVWGLIYLGFEAKGTAARIDNGRKQDMGTDIKWGYGMEWVDQQLNSHQLTGSRTITQKMGTPGGGHRNLGATTGTATITVTWKWEDVAK